MFPTPSPTQHYHPKSLWCTIIGFIQTYKNSDVTYNTVYLLKNQIENLGKFVLSRTNIPEDIFNENFATDWYLDANEALEYGLIDGIMDKRI